MKPDQQPNEQSQEEKIVTTRKTCIELTCRRHYKEHFYGDEDCSYVYTEEDGIQRKHQPK